MCFFPSFFRVKGVFCVVTKCFFACSDNQFGFKRGLSSSHVIYSRPTVKSVVNEYRGILSGSHGEYRFTWQWDQFAMSETARRNLATQGQNDDATAGSASIVLWRLYIADSDIYEDRWRQMTSAAGARWLTANGFDDLMPGSTRTAWDWKH